MKRILIALLALTLTSSAAFAQLFENLRALGGARYPVGDPSLVITNLEGDRIQGPKDIAVSDFDGDMNPDFAVPNKDGTVTLRFGLGDGTFGDASHLHTFTNIPSDLKNFYFTNYYTNLVRNEVATQVYVTNYPPPLPVGPPQPPIIRTNIVWTWDGTYRTNITTNTWAIEGPIGLRGLAVADFTSDGRPDITVASPGESVIYFFANLGGRQFAEPVQLPGWFGVRDLAAGDFDGDGLVDLAAAGTTNGVVQYRSLGNGTFQVMTNLTDLSSGPIEDDDYDFPQPAFYLEAFRQPGDTRDELAVSHAQRGKIWILRAGLDGALAVSGDIENVSLTAMDSGPLLSPATNGVPDLVTSYSRAGCVDIYAATNRSQRFMGRPAVSFFIPGGPRNVRIADLDRDGWNDLVVVSQQSDRVFIYRNEQGQFALAAEAVAGRFPREMDLGDFNRDGHPDLAVVNRYSLDVSVMMSATNLSSMGFLALDSIYPVDGGVSGLELRDLNGDGRPDVMQLHRDSAEFSVRITETNGRLSAPVYYAITNAFQPAAQIAVDVNSDGIADMVSANLSGSVTVRLGLAGGGFGDPQTFSLPADANGSLFALVPGDFNGDGKMDLAAGYLDCRVSFFRGNGLGGFVHTFTHMFIYEPRSMAAGDFDQDGDIDLAGGSWIGELVIVENPGDLLSATNLNRIIYRSGAASAATMKVVDQNNDGDPDFLFGSEGGFVLFLGGPALTFTPETVDNGGNDPDISSSTFVIADLNGDGTNDLASICASNSCLSISFLLAGQFQPILKVPVPFTRYLAAGDLDGDGFADLVGSGDVLWVALSGTRASNAPPSELLGARNTTRGVVINEVLPRNDSFPLAADGERNTDWVEIYNGTGQTVGLTGWRMHLIQTTAAVTSTTNSVAGSNQITYSTNFVITTNTFVFPASATLTPSGFRLLICSDRIRTPYHTGFNLPGEGATLQLLNGQNVEVDRVVYGNLDADLSYARYQDGLRSFVVNNIPSPGAPNVDNGAVDPVIDLRGVDLHEMRTPGQRLHFRATARDDQGIVNVSVVWRRLDIPDNQNRRFVLFDDGMMGDDAVMMDGEFTGVLEEGLPAGAQIQFFLECTDISDEIVTKPGNASFVSPGQPPRVYTFAIGVTPPQLEISEIVADNASGLQDEAGGRPDWVEIRNCSRNTVSLAGIGLSPKFFGDSERFTFTSVASLEPGQHLVIYADSNPDQGPLHAPFRLSAQGEQLVLTGTTGTGARFLIDTLTYGPQQPDTALARLGHGGPWAENTPTPRGGNVDGFWKTVVQSNTFILAYPTLVGRTYMVEHNDAVGVSGWTRLSPTSGVGYEQIVRQPLQPRRFYRVREE